jgi:plasmid stabilization system protein ParE
MIEHLAGRLVDRYGREAPAEAEQIVRLLRADGNDAQARVWAKVGDACRRMVEKPGKTPSKP